VRPMALAVVTLTTSSTLVGNSIGRSPGFSPFSFALLLRARRERPTDSRAAEQRDEVAAFHSLMPPVLPTEMIAHASTAGDCCAAGFQCSLRRLRVPGPSAMSAQCPS
jgi:hypothetical protein